MADANDGGVTCWYDGEFLLTGTHRPFDDGRWEPYIARPRADDDAREERMKAAEAAARVCREDAEANATRAEKAEVATMVTTRDRDEWKARATKAEAERDEARKALAGHLFDGESLSLREAIRSEMLKDYARAINAHDAATARATKAEAERDRTRECLDSVQRNYDGDTAYISKAVTEAGFTFCTTESQPEHAIEIVSAIEKLKAERDSARAELAEQRKLWEQIPGGPDYDADENDLSPDDAASHLAGIAIRRIDAETRGAGE